MLVRMRPFFVEHVAKQAPNMMRSQEMRVESCFITVAPSEAAERSRRLRQLLLVGASRLVAARLQDDIAREPEPTPLAAASISGSQEEV